MFYLVNYTLCLLSRSGCGRTICAADARSEREVGPASDGPAAEGASQAGTSTSLKSWTIFLRLARRIGRTERPAQDRTEHHYDKFAKLSKPGLQGQNLRGRILSGGALGALLEERVWRRRCS